MSKKKQVPSLKIAPRVTRAHGEAFAQRWREMQSEEIASEALCVSDVIQWPEEDPHRPLGEFFDPRRERFNDITDEITEQIFDAVMPAVAKAFVKAAREVLTRERRRQRSADDRPPRVHQRAPSR